MSVCIEGVLKAYFEPLGTDPEFAELAKSAVPAVMALEIDERVKTSFALASAVQVTSNPKQPFVP